MCDITRRGFLAGGAAFLSLAAEEKLLAGPVPAGMAQMAQSEKITTDVYFHMGSLTEHTDAVVPGLIEKP